MIESHINTSIAGLFSILIYIIFYASKCKWTKKISFARCARLFKDELTDQPLQSLTSNLGEI